MHSSRKLVDPVEASQPNAVESFAAGVAHEARNQIFALSATLDALEARFSAELAEPPHFAVMREELARLTALMSHLAELGRPNAPLLGVGSAKEAALDALGRAEPLAQSKRITLEFNGEDAHARFDHEHLSRALWRLTEYAVRRSPAESTVSLALEAKGTQVLLTLSDRGPRLESSQLARLFEPFFSPGRVSRGLELVLAVRSIRDQGGSVHVENAELVGIRTSISLPLVSSA